MGRTKTAAVTAPQALTEARDWMSRIGQLERNLEAITASQSDCIAKIKEEHECRADPIKETLEELKQGLQIWAEANKATLTKKAKTYDLGTGLIKWRIRPPRVSLRKIDNVLEQAKSLGLRKFIRTKEEVNKDAMLADPDTARQIRGVSISSEGEDFVIEPVKEPLSEGADA
ncbi:MAG: host-nuclease inhibitor Gam family protein [Pseudomonadota bacterium]